MNSISERQNSDRNITRLAAQRQLYSEIGVLDSIAFIFAVIIPLVCTVVQEVFSDLEWIRNASCIISIVMLGISVSISSSRKQKRDLAASIQQEFDIDVFQMPWDNKLFGAQKDLNCEIVEKSTKILRNKGQSDKLKNWYTSAVDSLPQLKAIEACQRENISWDVKLRARYRRTAWIALILVVFAPLIIGLIKEQSISYLLMKILIILPILNWIKDLIAGLSEDIKRIESIKRALLSTEEKQMEQLQIIQKDIYQNRKAAVKIPNWFYEIFKDNDEDKARRTVELGKQ